MTCASTMAWEVWQGRTWWVWEAMGPEAKMLSMAVARGGAVAGGEVGGRGGGDEAVFGRQRAEGAECGGKGAAVEVAEEDAQVGPQEAGRVSSRTSQLCLRALGNMGPRTALPDGAAEGVVRPWCRGERRGEVPGGGRLADAYARSGVTVARAGWPMGGGGVECGGGGVPGLAVVTSALDRQ